MTDKIPTPAQPAPEALDDAALDAAQGGLSAKTPRLKMAPKTGPRGIVLHEESESV